MLSHYYHIIIPYDPVLGDPFATKTRLYRYSPFDKTLYRSREKQVARYAELITVQNTIDTNRFLERTGCSESKTVVIPGNIGLPRCTSEYANKNLMVYPTLYDAYPDTVLEALHTGCTVIAAAVGGLPDLLQYPELLFKSGNLQEITDRIERCITDPVFYQHIRTLCAQRAAVHRFDWAERFEAAMENYGQRKE
ncbi:MAG: glycosyltransferase [Treponema sp.]|jgi:hypothetical protein|nr:glycosyltransferase [Treponema sp.]